MKYTKFFGILSGKGGVGKTTVAINFASALSSIGRNVVLVDANWQSPHLGLFLGTPFCDHTLQEALLNGQNLRDISYRHPSGLRVILSSLKGGVDPSLPSLFSKKLEELEGTVEAVIIDTSSDISNNVIEKLDCVIIVTTPDLVSVTDTILLLNKLKGSNILGLVVNKVKSDGLELTIKNIEELVGVKVIASITDEKAIREALHIKQPVVISHPDSLSSDSFVELANIATGNN